MPWRTYVAGLMFGAAIGTLIMSLVASAAHVSFDGPRLVLIGIILAVCATVIGRLLGTDKLPNDKSDEEKRS